MATAIQVQEGTKHLLDELKSREQIASDDGAIQHLLRTHIDPHEMFGITKSNLINFGKEDEMDSHEL